MNKKPLFLILLALVLIFPFTANADGEFCAMLTTLRTLMIQIGGSIVAIGWVVTGILYLTAAGGSRMEVAKKSIFACVIGTILVILATSAMTLVKSALNSGSVDMCSYLQILKTLV